MEVYLYIAFDHTALRMLDGPSRPLVLRVPHDSLLNRPDEGKGTHQY